MRASDGVRQFRAFVKAHPGTYWIDRDDHLLFAVTSKPPSVWRMDEDQDFELGFTGELIVATSMGLLRTVHGMRLGGKMLPSGWRGKLRFSIGLLREILSGAADVSGEETAALLAQLRRAEPFDPDTTVGGE